VFVSRLIKEYEEGFVVFIFTPVFAIGLVTLAGRGELSVRESN